jgi:hypothetical protein
MKPRVYLETTIPSYLTAWPSRDLIMAARQQITREWWDARRDDFELFSSELVVDEASAGDSDAATRRLEALANIAIPDSTSDAGVLADKLLNEIPLPPKAAADSLHIAIAATNGMEYLLTWNCTHIANAEFRDSIERICRESGFEPPIICTPEELLKG